MRRLNIVLVAPRIPANVGSVARTCLALGAELHLVGPFGFHFDQKTLRRYSVGYFEDCQPKIYKDHQDFWSRFPGGEIYFATKHGEFSYTELTYSNNAWLVFGNEEEGVAPEFWNFKGEAQFVSCRIPTVSVRCLNLSVSVAVMGFEVQRQWRQLNDWQGVG